MPANYVLLERIELNASAASVTFSNIPQSGYTDLKVVVSARTDRASTGDGISMQFNNSGGTAYQTLRLYGSGSSPTTNSNSSTSSANIIAYGVAADLATASTFGNSEFYIPNYTGSTNKSVSVDTVGENNAADTLYGFAAGLWSNTAAITSIKLTPSFGSNFYQYSTFSLYGLAAVGTTPVIAPKATGGNITSDGTYWIHTFNSTGTFTPLQGLTCDYLVVAGGGGGGDLGYTGVAMGGGGAGGFRTGTGLSVAAQVYTITVGAGGALNTKGNDSIFSTITSTGGGKGGVEDVIGGSGGSGGGGGGYNSAGSSGTGGAGNTPSTSPSQGNNGGDGMGAVSLGSRQGGGGGGASAAGTAAAASDAGDGGAGTASSITGTSVTYAGGGGGGLSISSGGTIGAGGAGGGGNGAKQAPAVAGTVNLGGGGGGAGGVAGGSTTYAAGAGGSGIVIIRYPIA